MPVTFHKDGIPVREPKIEQDKKVEPITVDAGLERFPLIAREPNRTLLLEIEEALQRERINPTSQWIAHEEYIRLQQELQNRENRLVWGSGTSVSPYHITIETTSGTVTMMDTNTNNTNYTLADPQIDNGTITQW